MNKKLLLSTAAVLATVALASAQDKPGKPGGGAGNPHASTATPQAAAPTPTAPAAGHGGGGEQLKHEKPAGNRPQAPQTPHQNTPDMRGPGNARGQAGLQGRGNGRELSADHAERSTGPSEQRSQRAGRLDQRQPSTSGTAASRAERSREVQSQTSTSPSSR